MSTTVVTHNPAAGNTRGTIRNKASRLVTQSHPTLSSICALVLAVVLSFAWITAGSAQGESGYIRMERSLGADETGQMYPAGLAFSPQAKAFYVLGANPQGKALQGLAGISKVDSLAGKLGSTLLAAQVQDPVNLAFDGKAQRLLILQAASRTLAEVPEGASGELEPQKIRSYDISRFGLQNPQGLSVDPASGRLFILDAAGPRLVRVDPAAGGSLDKGAISSVKLSAPGLSSPRGLAFDPSSGHLHVLAGKRLYEFTQAGALVASRDLAEFALGEPQGMVFAPSGDGTDDPEEMSVYISDGSQIAELTLIPPPTPAAADFNAAKKNKVQLNPDAANPDPCWWFSPCPPDPLALPYPPSPDPSGIAYVSSGNKLVVVDSEVEELDPADGSSHFQDANLWELNLNGSVIRFTNISKVGTTALPLTNEPTGVAWDSISGYYYFSDDGNKEIYYLHPGVDGMIGTGDDTKGHFDTQIHGNTDPEGIALDAANGLLYIADDTNREVFVYTTATAIPPNTYVSQFDLETSGVLIPEGIEYNPVDGTLFILDASSTNKLIFEFSLQGWLARTISISKGSPVFPGGIAIGPASDGTGQTRFYIVDRGADYNPGPYVEDGTMYEMTTPPANIGPTAVNDAPSTPEDTLVNINVYANDTDADNNKLYPPSANTECLYGSLGCSLPTNGTLVNNLDGTFGYTPTLNYNGADSFVYEICDAFGACDTATVSITVTPVNDAPTAVADTASTDEDKSVNIDVAGNDTDIDGNLVNSSANTDCPTCSLPAHGTLTNEGNGSFTYKPALNYNGADGFVYEICDTGSLCSTANVAITVDPVADPPVAKNDNVSTGKNTAVTINVAANDSDPDGNLDLDSANTDCPTCSLPNNGSLANEGGGSFTYTPDQNFSGFDSFVYQICDTLGACDTATVTITVATLNDPPVAKNDSASTIQNTAVIIDVAANDTDPDGNLDPSSTNNDCPSCTDPAHGSLTNKGDGTFSYKPALNFSGSDSFVYQICDTGSLCDTATVSIKVRFVKFYSYLPIISNIIPGSGR